jgi:hypothetical protein
MATEFAVIDKQLLDSLGITKAREERANLAQESEQEKIRSERKKQEQIYARDILLPMQIQSLIDSQTDLIRRVAKLSERVLNLSAKEEESDPSDGMLRAFSVLRGDIKIEDLYLHVQLSARARTALRKIKLTYLSEVKWWTLEGIRGCGEKTTQEVLAIKESLMGSAQ